MGMTLTQTTLMILTCAFALTGPRSQLTAADSVPPGGVPTPSLGVADAEDPAPLAEADIPLIEQEPDDQAPVESDRGWDWTDRVVPTVLLRYHTLSTVEVAAGGRYLLDPGLDGFSSFPLLETASIYGRAIAGIDGFGAQLGVSYGLFPVLSVGVALEVRRTFADTPAIDGQRTLVGASLEATAMIGHVTVGAFQTTDDGVDESVIAVGAGIGF